MLPTANTCLLVRHTHWFLHGIEKFVCSGCKRESVSITLGILIRKTPLLIRARQKTPTHFSSAPVRKVTPFVLCDRQSMLKLKTFHFISSLPKFFEMNKDLISVVKIVDAFGGGTTAFISLLKIICNSG